MRREKSSTRDVLCMALLAIQLLLIARSRSSASRYFCWAPFDTQTSYELTVTVPGRGRLSPREVRMRYRLDDYGRDNRSPQHLIDIVSQYEGTLGRPERADALMRYTVNGIHPGEWRWPPR
jgi:hypothetical protein